MDAASRALFDALLVDAGCRLRPGLSRPADAPAPAPPTLAAAPATPLVVLGQAFPASTFVGYDIAEDAIARARAEAQRSASPTCASRSPTRRRSRPPTPSTSCSASTPSTTKPTRGRPGADPCGADPRRHLRDGRTTASSHLEDNIANPMAPWIYGVSTLHCMTVSLADGGAGLGTAWGHQRACQMLAERRVRRHRTFTTPPATRSTRSSSRPKP